VKCAAVLAATGSNPAPAALASVLLLLAGSLALVAVRRRDRVLGGAKGPARNSLLLAQASEE